MYMELFRKAKEEVIEYGDVVCMGTDGLVHKVDSVYDIDRIIGICSDTMGFVLGGDCKDVPKDEQCPVGMVGKIWTKVFEDTDINPGDRVTVTPFGNVVRATSKANVFGIAMSKVKDGKVLLVIK